MKSLFSLTIRFPLGNIWRSNYNEPLKPRLLVYDPFQTHPYVALAKVDMEIAPYEFPEGYEIL